METRENIQKFYKGFETVKFSTKSQEKRIKRILEKIEDGHASWAHDRTPNLHIKIENIGEEGSGLISLSIQNNTENDDPSILTVYYHIIFGKNGGIRMASKSGMSTRNRENIKKDVRNGFFLF